MKKYKLNTFLLHLYFTGLHHIISRFHDSGSRILWKRQRQRQRQRQQQQYRYHPNHPSPQLLQTGLVDKAPQRHWMHWL